MNESVDPYRHHRGAYQEKNIGVRQQIARLRETERIRQRMKRFEAQQFNRAVNSALPEAMHDEL